MKITIDTNTKLLPTIEKGERKGKMEQLILCQSDGAFSKDSNGIPSAIGKDK